MYDKEKMFGFMTTKRMSLLKAYPEDINTIMRMFSMETGNYSSKEKKEMRRNWLEELQKEIDDTDNYTFIIRDKCNKEIGLLSSETQDGENYRFYIYFKSANKRVQFQEYICECLLEFLEDYTDVKKVEGIYSIVSFQSRTALILKRNVVFNRKSQSFF